MASKSMEQIFLNHRLDGTNFKLWDFQVKAVLRAQGLLDVVNGETLMPNEKDEKQKWMQQDGKATSILLASMNEDQANHILGCTTSKEIYKKIENLHKVKSEVRIMNLYEQYFSLKMTEEDSVVAYVSKCSLLAAEIEDQGEKLSENIKMMRIISSLSLKFKNFRTVWYNVKEGRTLDNLLPRLKLEEDQLKKEMDSESTEAAFYAKSRGMGKKPNTSIEELKKNSKCNFCKEIGHWRRECPKRNRNGNSSEEKESSEMAFTAAICDIISANYSDVWLADSGASKHMTSRREWFSELKCIEGDRYVTIANNERLKISGYGTICLEAWCNGKWFPIRLQDVKYVPGLKQNLFATASATAQGFSIVIHSDHCKIMDCDGATRAFGFKDARNQIRMAFRVKQNEHAYVCSTSSASLQQWHRRLGHINVTAIKRLSNSKIVDGIHFSDEKPFFCEECQYGKMKKTSHLSSNIRNAEKGQYIHVDVCGKMNETGIGETLYFLLLKDEATSFRYVYFMKHKSDVFKIFKVFLPMVKNATGNHVKYIRCDNGTEFINTDVQTLLSKKGIIIERIAPYTPEQNGFIERDNRTIQESVRTMLIASGLNKMLWPEAVRTAVYFWNRSCSTRNPETTPYESWTGEKPQLGHVKVFGTVGFALVPKQTGRKKWDAKAQKVHLVGYEPTTKNFRLYDVESKKVFISCDVKFNENDMQDDMMQYWVESDEDKSMSAMRERETRLVPNADEFDEIKTVKTGRPVNPNSGISNYTLRPVINPPRKYADEFSYSAIMDEPLTYKEAIQSDHSEKWLEAMSDELEALEKSNTWYLVDRPNDRNIVGCKWIFKVKIQPNSEQLRYKARLVAKGYSQHAGIDYGETFSPVVRYDSVRTVLAIAAAEDMEIVQFDIKTAFLNGDLEEEIYMEVPEGMDNTTSGKVCRLKKSLYGLKQASRAWNKKFTEFLTDCGLVQSDADNCVFHGIIDGDRVILLLYVDDGMILSSNGELLSALIQKLENVFEVTHGDVDCYVGMEIKRDREAKTISIRQSAYIRKLIDKFNLTDAKPISTPVDASVMLKKSEVPNEPVFPYRQAVGSLMYAATVSRPDISYAVGEVSRFLENPSSEHITAVKRIIRYLKGTLNYGIIYGSAKVNAFVLSGYTDADYARGTERRRSTTGYVFLIGQSIVTWRSHRQQTVALSTTEAEYMAAAEGAKEAVWIRQLLLDIGHKQKESTMLFIDNQSTIRLVRNPELHHRTKHIDVRHHFIRDLYQSGIILIDYVQSEDQLADAFTKPLTRYKFQRNMSGLGIVEVSQ